MPLFNVVLLQSDPGVAQSLVASMVPQFRSVRAVRCLDDLRAHVAKVRAQVVVLDMEIASIEDLQGLSHEFPGVAIVCTHRLADEEMWAMALNAGAADICPVDPKAIVSAALRTAQIAASAVA